MPTVYIIAGPNGAGKTYLSTTFVPSRVISRRFVNADYLESDLIATHAVYANPAIEAGRMMLRLIRAYADEGVDFVFETTLASRSFVKLIRQLQSEGYKVRLVFLWLSDVEIAVSRVAQRVRDGGHQVPELVIRRRFTNGLRNLFERYLHIVDAWQIYDNSDFTQKQLVAELTIRPPTKKRRKSNVIFGGFEVKRFIIKDVDRFEAIEKSYLRVSAS